MSTITRQQAQQIIEAADAVITALAGTNEDVHPDNSTKMVQLYDDLNDHYAPPEVVRELARIALVSMEAEPVLNVQFKDGWPVDGTAGIISGSPGIADGYHDFYTAPPAPVVQLQEWTNEQCLEFLSIAFRHAEIKGNLELDDIRLGVKMVNGSCTAMQGSSRTNGG